MCLLQIEVDKIGSEDLFQDYAMNYGIRTYVDEQDTTPVNLGESTGEITLDAPVFETEEWDLEEGLSYDIEYLDMLGLEKTYSGMDGAVETNVTIEYYAVKQMTLPDFVMVYFSAETETTNIQPGDIVQASVLFGANKAIGVSCEMDAAGVYTLASVDDA